MYIIILLLITYVDDADRIPACFLLVIMLLVYSLLCTLYSDWLLSVPIVCSYDLAVCAI